MNIQNFLQYDWWKPKRLIWDAPAPAPETPAEELPAGAAQAPAAAPQAPAEAREAVKDQSREQLAELTAEMDTFTDEIKLSGIDLEGGKSAERNPTFSALKKELNKFFEENRNKGRDDLVKDWRKAVFEYVKEEMTNYDNPFFDSFELTDIKGIMDDVKNPENVGDFVAWIGNMPDKKVIYDTWKAAKDAQEQSQKENTELAQKNLADKKKTFDDKAAALITRFETIGATAIGAMMLPESIATRITELKKQAAEADNIDKLKAPEGKLEGFEKSAADYESLKDYYEKELFAVPEEKKAEILAKVKSGETPPLDAKNQLAAKKQEILDAKIAAEQAAAKAAETNAAITDDSPFIDKAMAMVDQMEEGKWKSIAGKLLAGLAALFVAISKMPVIGKWVRGHMISNRTLAKMGDKNAELAMKLEDEFAKFGLTRNFANELEGQKTSDVITLLKDPAKLAKLAKDAPTQQKLKNLADQLAAKGGSQSDETLVSFMTGNPNWKDVSYAASGARAAAAPSTTAGENAGAAAAGAAGAAAASGAEEAPSETAENPELVRQKNEKIDAALARFQDITTDVETGEMAFQLPYIENGAIAETSFVMSKNNVIIGDKRYKIEISKKVMGVSIEAQIKSIAIHGSIENGNATITAAAGENKQSQDISIKKLFEYLEDLRQRQTNYQIPITADTKLTFTKLA